MGNQVAAHKHLILLEAAIGIEPMNKGFADLCLTTWLRRPEESRRNRKAKGDKEKLSLNFRPSPFDLIFGAGDEI